ncbi:unnamed protein product [Musa acuminata subsp. burmannicoides]
MSPPSRREQKKQAKDFNIGSLKPDEKTGTGQNGSRISKHDTLLAEIKSNLSKVSTPNQLQTSLVSLTGSPQGVMTVLFEALFEGAGKGFVAAAVQGEESQATSASCCRRWML